MKNSTRFQLMAMMFLLYFVWGAWYGQMSKYMFTELGATGVQVGNAYAAFSIAMIIAPFFVGMIADRYFAAQKVLGILNLVGAGILYVLSEVKDPDTFFWVILAYCITFAPAMSLTTSIAMQQVTDSEKDFPAIRVMGTVAWIAVTNIVGYYKIGDTALIFKISMYTAAFLGVYSFFLPNTPPKPTSHTSFSDILGLDAFKLFKDRSFAIFFISSLLICIPLSFYYAMANPSLTDSGMTNVENKMSLGQASEVVFMLLIPLAFSRFGVKWMLVVGLIAWIIRFIGFGYGDASSEWLLYLAIVLHGVCYDFFFVTGQIYTDSKAGEQYRSSAQGLISIATYGIGMGIGSWIAGVVADMYTVDNVKNWTSIWMVPAGIAAVVLVLFVLFFRDNKVKAAS
ncbi:nucleoside transporter [Dyadobacter sp. BE34]|uniref:Nucleoside transporter n=1 Tax=Dyadobacter fermentans TaxID=94254 RepID=A0ABU1R426_9BACT|nr:MULTISPECIES: nucleoside permease [Dyadobacter]MDR6808138.1 nucleoside transporter [Dyadobacter fermentans]MDR7046046.1 nucleoside transporter [Dyadobacter sp. BE242]MDR7200359.1 nucleoside transporter [Dyadobacter sp. BE34]MDR7218319.1 nucleoside transporter [Dyadobacter sp. BE31]MDR7266250.1 nucleoside transporter [Dyadobacter sp. BE32]